MKFAGKLEDNSYFNSKITTITNYFNLLDKSNKISILDEKICSKLIKKVNLSWMYEKRMLHYHHCQEIPDLGKKLSNDLHFESNIDEKKMFQIAT